MTNKMRCPDKDTSGQFELTNQSSNSRCLTIWRQSFEQIIFPFRILKKSKLTKRILDFQTSMSRVKNECFLPIWVVLAKINSLNIQNVAAFARLAITSNFYVYFSASWFIFTAYEMNSFEEIYFVMPDLMYTNRQCSILYCRLFIIDNMTIVKL